MKKFSLHSVANVMAIRPSRVEIGGHRVALPGIASAEPLMRGCNQRDWLEKLTALGIRHLVIPLNNGVEDACVFARRHPASSESETNKSGVLYDLAHKDEGVFARLHFLFEAAEQIGVLIGLSLFNAHGSRMAGPFQSHCNEQGVSFDDLLKGATATESALLRSVRKKNATQIRRRAAQRDKLQAALNSAVDWVGAAVRGRRGVWVEVCRGGGTDLDAPPSAPSHVNPLAHLEPILTQRLIKALAKPGEDAAKAKLGPWVSTSNDFAWNGSGDLHIAPFTVQHDVPLGQRAIPAPTATAENEAPRRPQICWLASGRGENAARGPQRAALWRSVMRGCWPLVSITLSEETDHRGWKDMAQIATFNRQWVGGGYMRPCPDILAHMPERVAEGKICAATDGAGRYYAFLTESLRGGLKLSTLPGSYRYYWFDPASGRGLDYGDGIEGGLRCAVPTPGSVRHALLILEQEELPDPFSVW